MSSVLASTSLDSATIRFIDTIHHLDSDTQKRRIHRYIDRQRQAYLLQQVTENTGDYEPLTEEMLLDALARRHPSRIKKQKSRSALSRSFATDSTASLLMAAPANDDFANAQVLSTATGTTSGDTSGATAEAGEPDHFTDVMASHSVWFEWTAPTADPVDFDTTGSNFDTVLAVYTGSSVNELTLIDNNDDDPLTEDIQSRVSLNPVMGVTYYIAVDGYDGDAGQYTLNWGGPPPANTIDGNINLPGGHTAPAGGLEVIIEACPDDGDDCIDNTVTIPASLDTIPYSLRVPTDPSVNWTVGYACFDCSSPLINLGYYSSSETNSTTADIDEAELLAGGNDYNNIDMTIIQGNAISGTLSLPSGFSAPADGLNLLIDACPYGGGDCFTTDIQIPASGTSVAYSISVPSNVTTQWRINYSCSSCASALAQLGFFSSSSPNTTTANSAEATLLAGGSDHSSIDMTVIRTYSISGKIQLPAGINAPAPGWFITVDACETSSSVCSTKTVFILQGFNSTTYSLASSSDPNSHWQVSYTCTVGGCGSYLGTGYYSSAAPTMTTPFTSDATTLPGGSDHSNIDLTLVKVSSISGAINLPAGMPAPAGGLDINLQACPDSGGTCSSLLVTFLEGESSKAYSINIPAAYMNQWSVSYDCSACPSPLVQQGYYSSGAVNSTTAVEANATLLTGDSNHTNINMTVIKLNGISGEINLPDGDMAPSGGLAVDIEACPDNAGACVTSTVTILTGEGSTPYSLDVDASFTGKWSVGYDCSACTSPLVQQGYYSTAAPNKTIANSALATLLPGGSDYPSIDMTVIKRTTISGTIHLPAGMNAPVGGLDFSIRICPDSGGSCYVKSDTIPQGQNSLLYNIGNILPTFIGQWIVSYDCSACTSTLIQQGYYSVGAPNTTTAIEADATALAVDSDHSGIDMTILKLNIISGIIKLPAGYLAQGEEGLGVDIEACPDDAGPCVSTLAEIPEGGSSTPYSMEVDDSFMGLWTVNYDCSACASPLVQKGYYSSGALNTTTVHAGNATPLNGGSDHANIHMTIIDSTLVDNVISGSINLPLGYVAPAGGLDITMGACPVSGGNCITDVVTMPEGNSSSAYTIMASSGFMGQWTVNYDCQACVPPLIQQGYYADSETNTTTADEMAATYLDSGQDHAGINLTVVMTIECTYYVITAANGNVINICL